MLKVSHTTLIVLSGLVWLGIGTMLFFLGLNFLVESILKENLQTLSRPLLDPLASLVGDFDTALFILLALGLVIGYAKGYFVLSKSVKKGVERIIGLPNPAPLSQIYTRKYYILLGSMVLLGMAVRFAPLDIRGAVDIAIGYALVTGAIQYFKSAFQVRATCGN